MAVSKRLRYEILRRDNHACRYCGATAPDVKLTIDHVIPEALGGTDTPDNLVTACADCNNGKTSSTPDATLVADVSQDALRWAAAIKQAAEILRAQEAPKLEYRAAFETEWNRWTYPSGGERKHFDLPDGWKSSIERFRQSMLPVEVWPDIVEKAMTNKTVRSDNLFRYCCGIAWRMVRELQEHAKTLMGDGGEEPDRVDSVVQAAIDVWKEDQNEVDASALVQLQSSVIAAREDEEPHRLVEAAQYGSWYGMTDIREALAKLDRDEALEKWTFAWFTRTGDWPGDDRTEMVRRQINELLNVGVRPKCLERAVIYAGSRRSARIYFGLSERELEAANQSEVIARAAEIWAEAFHAATERWPTKTEISAFFDSFRRVIADGDIWISDIYQAAAAVGAYQDPDMSTGLARHLSVFEAAARPLAPSA